MDFLQTSPDLFQTLLNDARRMRGEGGLYVSDPEPGARLYVASDLSCGFALTGGYLGSVWSRSKGMMAEIIKAARKEARLAGASALTLDCFEGLARVYASHGFTETARLDFDWQYAPKGWTKAMGEPDVVMMAAPLSEAPMLAPVVAPMRPSAPL